jgi:diguanylate cyclase (GGDEF)-like protein/PAS domain S-box-containing protein
LFLWVTIASSCTAIVGLHQAGLLGTYPLWLLVSLVILVGGHVEVASRYCRRRPSVVRMHWVLASQMTGTTVMIYAIGFGPTLAIGYVIALAEDLENFGLKAKIPALAWTLGSMTVGQLAVAANVVPTVVPSPYVHGLAVLCGLAIAMVMHLIATKTAARDTAEVELQAGEESFRVLFAANPAPMAVYDEESLLFLEVNDAAVRHYGYSREEFLGMLVHELRPEEESIALMTAEERHAAREERGSIEWRRHQVKDGRIIEVDVQAHNLVFRGRPCVLAAVTDVTVRNALEDQLRDQALHDPLTGLANRVLFRDRTTAALGTRDRRGRAPAVLLLDLDGFKTVNDSLGHTTGDSLLCIIGQRIVDCVRDGDTVARLGGDEFAVLIEHLNSHHEVAAAVERLLAAISKPLPIGGRDILITASVGIAFSSGDEGPEEMIRNADTAMYEAKAAGKARARTFAPAMHAAALARLQLEAELRDAITYEQFRLDYQPIVAMGDGHWVGAEALLRWDHPRRGLVMPDEFISVSEDTGLIVAIGTWVLREACRAANLMSLAADDPDFSISVNLSTRQVLDAGLLESVASALELAGIAPRHLTLEITESVLIHDMPAALEQLRHLKALGVKIALDDFGTGYSSLSYLRSLPVDVLKIDKSFVDGVPGEPSDEALLRSILHLAREMGLIVVAEGVETTEQAEWLRSAGCHLVQGYYFARPMPAESLSRRVVPRTAAPPRHHPLSAERSKLATSGLRPAEAAPRPAARSGP